MPYFIIFTITVLYSQIISYWFGYYDAIYDNQEQSEQFDEWEILINQYNEPCIELSNDNNI
jgi:hypothetical protein